MEKDNTINNSSDEEDFSKENKSDDESDKTSYTSIETGTSEHSNISSTLSITSKDASFTGSDTNGLPRHYLKQFQSDFDMPISTALSDSGFSFRIKSMRNLLSQEKIKDFSKVEPLYKYFNHSSFRLFINEIVENKWFNITIFVIIILNTIIISMQTNKDLENKMGWYFTLIDSVFLSIYTVEIILKLYVYRFEFFSNEWNIFAIVGSSLLEMLVLSFLDTFITFDPKIFRILRAFRSIRAIRALRILRTITFLNNLQTIVATILRSIPAWGSISSLLFLFLYIFSIIGVSQFREDDPSRWGNIWVAMFSLFQLITLDDWFEMYDAVSDQKPAMIIFLISFIILETFIFINLFIAVIVNGLARIQSKNFYKAKLNKEKEAQDKKILEMYERMSSTKNHPTTHIESKLQVNASTLNNNEEISSFMHHLTNPRMQKNVSLFFMLLASLENHIQDFTYHQSTLNHLVDNLPGFMHKEKEEKCNGKDNFFRIKMVLVFTCGKFKYMIS